jgi:hypothetical protein
MGDPNLRVSQASADGTGPFWLASRACHALYSAIYVDENGVNRAVLNPPFAELRNRCIGLIDEDEDGGDEPDDGLGSPGDYAGVVRPGKARRARPAPKGAAPRARKSPAAQRPRGSNVTHLAEGRELNPRETKPPLTVFETAAFELCDVWGCLARFCCIG